MIDFTSLPLTPDNARAARNYLGLSQAKAAEESALPAHKIKRFEAGNYIPDEPFLRDLRTFFEQRGYEFQGTPKPGERARASGVVFPAAVVGGAAADHDLSQPTRPHRSAFHHMRIAVTDEDSMGRILDLIDLNEERVQELLQQPLETGLFGGLTEDCEARQAEAVSLLAENGRMFGLLFGREVGGPPNPDVLEGKAKPATHADLMHRRQADATLFALQGSQEAKARVKARKPPESVSGAIFGL